MDITRDSSDDRGVIPLNDLIDDVKNYILDIWVRLKLRELWSVKRLRYISRFSDTTYHQFRYNWYEPNYWFFEGLRVDYIYHYKYIEERWVIVEIQKSFWTRKDYVWQYLSRPIGDYLG